MFSQTKNIITKSKLYKFFAQTRAGHIILCLIVIAIASFIFTRRYLPAFEIPNFYAEDGKVFMNNTLHKNPISAVLTAFNGYLVVGQYIVTEAAALLASVLHLHFFQLPKAIAVMSCVFLGLTAALPFILFRKRFGFLVTILMVVFGSFVAIPSFDYAIIGTIGNLKFLFLYWAFLFCLYRNYNSANRVKTITSDAVILLSILTYAPAAALLPFIFWPYRKQLLRLLKRRNKHELKKLLTSPVISAVALCAIAFVYLTVVYMKGIPKIPGYLDTAYDPISTVKIAYRSTWYAWLYPISSTMRDIFVVGLLGVITYFGLKRKDNRFVFTFAAWSIAVGTISFVANRPGISSYFLAYGPNPDQFFYAQTLIFMFLTVYILRGVIGKNMETGIIAVIASFLFLWWSIAGTGSFGGNRIIYEHLGTARHNVESACMQQKGDWVTIQNYPTEEWTWKIERSIACR